MKKKFSGLLAVLVMIWGCSIKPSDNPASTKGNLKPCPESPNCVLSIFIQDHSASSSVVGTPLHVYDFAVGVRAPAPVGFSTSLNFFGKDVVIVVPSVSGHTYQLRVATTLSPPDWANVGPVVPGVDGLLALPDPSGTDADHRYYGVVRDP